MTDRIATVSEFGRTVKAITRRVLGVDAGKTAGFAILDVPLTTLIQPTFIECGELDPARRAGHMRDLISTHRVELCGFERILKVHPKGRGKGRGIGARMATSLLRTGEVVAELRNEAIHAGMRVNWVQAKEWRKAIVGKCNAEPDEIKNAILLRIPGWPGVSNNHHRDAGGVALWTGLTTEIRKWEIDDEEEAAGAGRRRAPGRDGAARGGRGGRVRLAG